MCQTDPQQVGLAHIAMLFIQRMNSIATLSGTLVGVWSGFISIKPKGLGLGSEVRVRRCGVDL